MIEKEIVKHEQRREQLVAAHGATNAELQKLLMAGPTEKVALAQAQLSALDAQISAQDETLERMRSRLDDERRRRKLSALRRLANEYTKIEAEKNLAADKAEAAIAEYVSVAVNLSDAQRALRERFTEAGGEDAEFMSALTESGTDASAICGHAQARQTQYARILDSALMPIWLARIQEKQAAERVSREERRRKAQREHERRIEEARRADAEEERRLAERAALREKEDSEARRAYAESLGLEFREC